jgi:hypothetical protein
MAYCENCNSTVHGARCSICGNYVNEDGSLIRIGPGPGGECGNISEPPRRCPKCKAGESEGFRGLTCLACGFIEDSVRKSLPPKQLKRLEDYLPKAQSE